MAHVLPIANGLRTDHPVPGLPFVDDSHLPLNEGPEAIEAVGRNQGKGMWGRWDKNRAGGGWRAFTTDPLDHTLAWAVRYHPEHGQTVLLVSNGNTSFLHGQWDGEELLFRAGGYWWDGTTWYRPGQIFDPLTGGHERRKARMAVTVTAADLLDKHADPAAARIAAVTGFAPGAPRPDNWHDHLALWARHHQERADARPLEQCVVDLSSPELVASQLLGAPELAELGGISASTLRAYISRGSSEVPLPQATVGNRDQWSRAVAQDWVEARQRSYQGVGEVMSAGDRDSLSPGAAEVRDRFAADFQHTLFDRPDLRKRWALRHRNKESVGEVADTLAWSVGASLDQIVPTRHLGQTVLAAVVHDFTDSIEMFADERAAEGVKWWHLNLMPPVAKTLDWYIRCFPGEAHAVIGEIQSQAHKLWQVPAADTLAALQSALSLDGELTEQQRETYFALLEPHADSD
ncbi:hypothetical protein [Streptacidiphilus anmyonensis]|uniref:hypothetical protein n=1 Tax=Streptacidiphilus anmyonensis TaxID=405782 RepID=UPI0005A7BD80|nr:hypothetical protein [Streptacidiphilus anmyonensis]